MDREFFFHSSEENYTSKLIHIWDKVQIHTWVRLC